MLALLLKQEMLLLLLAQSRWRPEAGGDLGRRERQGLLESAWGCKQRSLCRTAAEQPGECYFPCS